MDSKVCVVCNTGKSIEISYNKYKECKPCIIRRSTRRYYENKDKITKQQKNYYEANRDFLLAKSKLNQQNKISHTRQLKDLNNKVKELTQATETLILKFEPILIKS